MNSIGVPIVARISKNQLIKLQKKYRTDQAIAALYGLTRQAVHRMRKMYGIAPAAEKTNQRDMDIMNLHKRGISVSRISDKYGLSNAHVYRIIRKYNDSSPDRL